MGEKISFRVIAELAIGVILLAVVVSQFFTMDRLKTDNMIVMESNALLAVEYKALEVTLNEAKFYSGVLQEQVKKLKETNFQMQRLLLLPNVPVTSLTEITLIHTVVKGDWLSKLAKRYYGDARKWPRIWASNPHINDPDLIYPGQKIKVSFIQ